MRKPFIFLATLLGACFAAYSQIPTDNSITYRNNEPIRLLSKLGFELGPKEPANSSYFLFNGGSFITNSNGKGTFTINTTNGTDGVFINGTNLTEILSQLSTIKKVPMFVIPLNVLAADNYNGFELQASTNNFQGSSLFDCRSENANSSTNGILMFICTGKLIGDERSYQYLPSTSGWTNRISSLVVIPNLGDAEWLNESNEELTWIYRRYRISGGTTNYENEAGTELPLWRPVVPSRWCKEVPNWAKEAVAERKALTWMELEDGTSQWFDFEGEIIQQTMVDAGLYDINSGEWIKIPINVEIGSKVTSIGAYTFSYCDGLISVTIPNSVTSIGDGVFNYCSGLTSITIPNSVTTIGNGIFDSCSGLTSVTIPNSVTSIGKYAFNYCSGLTSITIPNSVISIGDWAFSGCIGLTSVTIPNSVISIGDNAFNSCIGLISVTIPNSVISIGDNAFNSCIGLISVTISNSVISIGVWAFESCDNLKSVTMEGKDKETVQEMDNYAWKLPSGCKIHCTDDDIEL